MELVTIADELASALERLPFSPPVAYVYNPLLYAREPYHLYLARYGGGRKETVFVGMNPGPWGMAQTGVPFGEPVMVRDWMGIEGGTLPFAGAHPRCPVMG